MQAVAFSPDGGQAATASRDGTWCVWGLGVRHWLQEDPKKLLQVRALSRRIGFNPTLIPRRTQEAAAGARPVQAPCARAVAAG